METTSTYRQNARRNNRTQQYANTSDCLSCALRFLEYSAFSAVNSFCFKFHFVIPTKPGAISIKVDGND